MVCNVISEETELAVYLAHMRRVPKSCAPSGAWELVAHEGKLGADFPAYNGLQVVAIFDLLRSSLLHLSVSLRYGSRFRNPL